MKPELPTYVTDTMAIVSYLDKRKLPISVKQIFQNIVSYLDKRKLPISVKQIFQNADVGLSQIYIPAIVLFEIGYLFEKGILAKNSW